MTFWIAACALAALAVVLVALPGRSAAGSDDARADHLRRLREFDADVALGDIDPDDADAARAEIERAVLTGADTADDRTPNGDSPTRGSAVVPRIAALVVPLGAALVYLQLGQPDIAVFDATHPGAGFSEPGASVSFLLEAIEREAAAQPNDVAAQTILARTYLRLGRYDDAVTAAERVAQLAANDNDARLLLADALSMQAGGALPPRAVASIDAVLTDDPDNTAALVLRGIADEQRGDHDAAVARWQRALRLLPPDSPLRAELSAMLAPPAPPTTAATFSITATIELDPALVSGLAPDTPVFTFLRSDQGGPPLAAVRSVLGDLPGEVTLDRPLGMGNATPAAGEPVTVVVRVAVGGGPTASPGDLEGRSESFALGGDRAVAVRVDRRLGD